MSILPRIRKKGKFKIAPRVKPEYKDDMGRIENRHAHAVIVIGNFDGVHKGHQALIEKGMELARVKGCVCGVLTFEPHPKTLFRPDEPPARLTPLDMKRERLQAMGVDFVHAVEFDWAFASRSSDYFIEEILKNQLKAQHVVVGYNFRFGQLRKGTPAQIEAACIPVTLIDKVATPSGEVYSSSLVRQALRVGNVERANAILGWPWEIRGEVIKGDQRGRELGYPTANMQLGAAIHPAYGIYAARVKIMGEEEWLNAAINIGIRPMFEVPVAQVESHILDFNRDIYGQTLRVQLVKRLRGEAKFDSLQALIKQIDEDCHNARKVLSSHAA